MGQDKKKLEQLLDFVAKIYADKSNREFIDGIRALVLSDKDLPGSSGGSASLDKITTYLSLDYDLDTKDFPDYSFIEEESVRETLLADFREMLRYQYGTRSHRIDFLEFCRFGVLQAEMLINYFFEKKYNSDFGRVVKAIQLTNSSYVPGDHLSQICDIPLKTKAYRIRHELGWDNDALSPILNAIEVRNRQSHRSLRLDKDKIQEYEKRFKDAKVWFFRDSVPMYKKALDQNVVTQKEMNEYTFQVWFELQPFDEIIRAIKNLSTAVSIALVVKPSDTQPPENSAEESTIEENKPADAQPSENSSTEERKPTETPTEERKIEDGESKENAKATPPSLKETVEQQTDGKNVAPLGLRELVNKPDEPADQKTTG